MGRVVENRAAPPGRRLCLEAGGLDLECQEAGSSIAVNGVCLSVTQLEAPCFRVEVTGRTLELSNLGDLREREAVNLETSLTLSTPLGGHLVAGHVDAAGEVLEPATGGQAGLAVRVPPSFRPYLCARGSVAVDGVSLTVAEVGGDCFRATLIPHTLEYTTLGRLRVGARVNLEADLVARYLERLLEARGWERFPREADHGAS